ncbi:MAG: peptidoglycan DD-metalloendopeptidase family protein [Betaproteobacteria bacterium]|nr:peptidoglycan DD-metalloendopeptidase family protein [Betaproteobacteria bacterium]
MAGLCVAGTLACGPADAAREKEALEQLRSRIEQAQKDLAAAESAHSEATDQLRESETAISEANRSLRDLAQRQRQARAALRELASDSRKMRDQIEAREEQVGTLVRAHYFTGDQRLLKLLLSGDDPNRIARSLAYYEYVFRAQTALISELRDRMDEIASLEQRSREGAAALAELERQAQAERAKLVATAAERRKVLATISREISGQRRQIQTLQRDEKRLARLVDELAKALRSVPAPPPSSRPRNERVPGAGDVGPFSRAKGQLRLPVRGELAGRFGAPRQGSSLTWKGVLILAPEGEEVRAVASGRVVFADWMRGFGNLLILDHGENYLTIYGYNEALLKKVGEPVHAGDVIATVGATGGAGTSGLYFEIRHEGKPFDPLTWVSLK